MTGGRRDGARIVLGLARRDLLERVRTRAFQISTAVLVLVVGGVLVLPQALGGTDRTEFDVGLVGPTPAALPAAVRGAAGSGPEAPRVELRTLPGDQAAALALDEEEVDVVVVGADRLLWPDDADPVLDAVLRAALTRVAVLDRAAAAGIPAAEVGALLAPVDVEGSTVGDGDDRRARRGVAVFGLVLLFASINLFGGYVLMGVVEEKSNRVVEVLLARVAPHQLLAGKVLGAGAAGLLQFAVLGAVALATLIATRPEDLPDEVWGAIPTLVVWFVLGFGFYAVLYACAGSLVSRAEDAQAAVGPLTAVLAVLYTASFVVVESPDAPLAVVATFLPPSAPLVTPARMALTDVPWWQVGLAGASTVAGTVAMVRLGGRLYRGAVLRIGPRLGLREAWRSGSR